MPSRHFIIRWIKLLIKPLIILSGLWLTWQIIAFFANGQAHRRREHRVSAWDRSFWLASAANGTGLAKLDVSTKLFCGEHGWKPFRPTRGRVGKRRKIYDLVMVNTELDWLEIRLATLYDHVDYFVVVESPRTFTFLEKPLVLKMNWDKF